MNAFSSLIGLIDDDLLVEAQNSHAVKRSAKWRKIAAIAACLIFIVCAAAFLPNILRARPGVIGKTYASVADIKVKRIGNNYTSGGALGGPVELMELDGTFYFSAVTRMVGNNKTRETVYYCTLFRYNIDDGSCTAISDEVGHISLNNDRFIYTRSDLYLTAKNVWNVDYYTNNSKWNDERKISGNNAKELLTDNKYTTIINGKTEEYTIEENGASFKITFPGSGKVYNIILDFKSVIPESTRGNFSINYIYGITNNKIYFSATYHLSNGQYQWQLFCIGLDGTEFKLITADIATNTIGVDAYLGDDGYLYYHYRGTPSYIMKLDTRTDTAQVIAEVNGFVWKFVSNGEYALCQISRGGPEKPTTAEAVKLR